MKTENFTERFFEKLKTWNDMQVSYHIYQMTIVSMYYIMFTVYSTVSSSVNALAAVTIADLIRPYLSLSEKQLSWASKGMSEWISSLRAN